MMKLTLNALFDYVNDDGIFTYLNSFDVPWKSDVDYDLLDLDYHSKRGTKVVSNTVVSLLDDDGLSAASKTKLAKLLYTKNKAKWDELWNSMGLYDEFDPLDNTNWTETETIQHYGSDSRSQTIGQKQNTFVKGSQTNSASIGEQTITEGQQVITNGTHTDTHEEKRSAYNSSNYSPNVQNTDTIGQQQDTIGQKINTNGARNDGSTEGARTDTQTEGSQSNSESGTDSYTDTHSITRHGNIGVTTSGQLIDDFRRVVNWQYFDIIFNDIDDVLTIDVFGRLDDDFDDYTITSAYKLPIASANVLGGIKVGQNLQIAADGTLKAVVESGVDSVNGKTGIVVLVPSDIGAASSSDLSTLSGTVTSQGETITAQGQAINNIRQVPDGGNLNQILRKVVSGYMWDNAREVPALGSTGQVLTKTADGYEFSDPAGGGGSLNVFNIHNQLNNNDMGSIGFRLTQGLKMINISEGKLGSYDRWYQTFVMNNLDWTNRFLMPYCATGHILYDDKIIALVSSGGTSPSSSNNIGMNAVGSLDILTSDLIYTNDVTSVQLAYKDAADSSWTVDVNDTLHHIMVGGAQYNSYTGNNKIALSYTDANDVSHDLTSLLVDKVSVQDSHVFCTSCDLDNVYVKTLTITSASGYRCKYALFYY